MFAQSHSSIEVFGLDCHINPVFDSSYQFEIAHLIIEYSLTFISDWLLQNCVWLKAGKTHVSTTPPP